MKKSHAVLGLLLLAVSLLGAAASPLLSVTFTDPLTGARELGFSVGALVALTAPTALVYGAAALALSLVRSSGQVLVAGVVTGISLLLGWRLFQVLVDLEQGAAAGLRAQETVTGTLQSVTGPHWGAWFTLVLVVLAAVLSFAVVRSRKSWAGTSSGKYEAQAVEAQSPDSWSDWDAISRGDDPSSK